jgi:hypothetical protein
MKAGLALISEQSHSDAIYVTIRLRYLKKPINVMITKHLLS